MTRFGKNKPILSTSQRYIYISSVTIYVYIYIRILLNVLRYMMLLYGISSRFCNSHTTHTEYIHLYIYTYNVMFIMHYHVRCLAQCTCIMHHFSIRCHRAKVAMLTAKIESTMPRPQRTALNEAPSCLVFG